ncbi:hypothetical protein K439DRAFT_1382514 [Ramaria rubella]|nr:hypothetical protein K439DRAFT_1382514 [Ramaria rubella]
MPRRPPPSALRLHPGPTPSRQEPKHRIPSIPVPAFYPSIRAPLNPSPARARSPVADLEGWFVPAPAQSLRAKPALRGPWDHSRSLSESTLDVDSLIRAPRPAAVIVSPMTLSVW